MDKSQTITLGGYTHSERAILDTLASKGPQSTADLYRGGDVTTNTWLRDAITSLRDRRVIALNNANKWEAK